jgi:D-threo-aldose 1-dehydrogenase
MQSESARPGVRALGFGCADLFRAPSSAERLRLLETAFDAGVRHFDVAPMYGLGLAEAELGRFARRHRDAITIATKFGIRPTAVAAVAARVQGPIRRILERSPELRRRARERAPGPSAGAGSMLYRLTGYDAKAAAAGLDASLAALKTDHIDLLLFHDADAAAIADPSVVDFLEGARASGKIGSWGAAGEPPAVIGVARALGRELPVEQIREDVFSRASGTATNTGARKTITFGVLGAPLARLSSLVSSSPEARALWETQGPGTVETPVLAALLFQEAALAHHGGTVLFSSINPSHIRAAAGALDEHAPTWPHAERLRGVVTSLLGLSAQREHA